MEQIKKYIRGNTKRGHEVIAELEKLGGKNTMKLCGHDAKYIYYIERFKYTNANTIDFVSEKSFIGQLIVTHPDWKEIELSKYKYPKTYEECAKVLLDRASVRNDFGYKGELLVTLQKLLVCRDAYWKIAGEQMGLDKSWEPDWKHVKDKFYCISTTGGEIVLGEWYIDNKILAFPLEEMRDAFKENFAPDIEICKEFL